MPLIRVVLLSCLLPVTVLARTELHHTDEVFTFFEEARPFRGVVDGIDVVGVDIGPLDGEPAVGVPGYTQTFPYFRNLARKLKAQKVRAFLFNPPGQGRGDVGSGKNAKAEDLGIDGMLKVFPAVRHFAFQATGKKVTVFGHSLGGAQVRLGSLGIVFDKNGDSHFSNAAFQQAQDETALIVPMFSFALYGDEAFENHGRLKALALTDGVPLVIDCVAALSCFFPDFVNRVSEYLAIQYLKIAQDNWHQGLYGAADLVKNELDELGNLVFPHKVSAQIRKDLTRWLQTKKFSTSDDRDWGSKWKQVQSGPNPFPVLYISGAKDGLTPREPFVAEASAQPTSSMVTVDTGHSGALFSETVTPALAKLISRSQRAVSEHGCRDWLEARELQKIVRRISVPVE